METSNAQPIITVPNKYVRYQKNIKLIDHLPTLNKHCACGCGKSLTGRQTRWASRECSDRAYFEFSIIKGNTSAIRKALYEIDNGFCRNCGVFDNDWQADHILPVFLGGGACGLFNLQTLCPHCHQRKTAFQRIDQTAAISSHAAVNESKWRLYALGAVPKFCSKISTEIHPLLSISLSA